MKFKVGDRVLITAGKDKGKKSVIVALLVKENKVLVKDLNLYYKHSKPYMDKAGEKTQRERPLPLANIAVLNDQDQPDRLGYRFTADGQKERIFRKTGQLAKVEKLEKTIKATKKANKAQKKDSAVTDVNPKSSRTAIEVEKKTKKSVAKKVTPIRRIRQTQDKG